MRSLLIVLLRACCFRAAGSAADEPAGRPRPHRRAPLRRPRPARLAGHPPLAVPGARHRRLQVPGRHRLAHGTRVRHRLRLHQGDRGRRPHRRPLPRQLAGRPRRRGAARRLSLLLLLPPGGRAGGLVHQPRPARRRARCRRCSTSNGPTSRRPAATAPTPPRSAARRCIFLAGADRLLRQAAGHLHHRRLLPRQRTRAAPRLSTSGCARCAGPAPVGRLPDQRWAFWQYTGTGLVDGIDGPTDINVFGGTRAQWASWANGG